MKDQQETHLYTILSRLKSGQINSGQVIAEIDQIIAAETSAIRSELDAAQSDTSKYQAAVETYQRLLKNKEDLINILHTDNSNLIRLLEDSKASAS